MGIIPDEVNDEAGSSSDEENDLIQPPEDFMDDSRVLNALTAIPDKYVIFSEEDQEKVTTSYGTINEVVIERDYKHVSIAAAKATVKILQNCRYYSLISSRTLLCWYELKDATNK